MATFGIAMVKDEIDILPSTLDWMATQVDALVVADNMSNDGTTDLLHDLADLIPLTVIEDPDPAYYQSAKMTHLAAWAVEEGADWVVPFDADEIWYSPFGRIADVLAQWNAAVLSADLYDHVATANDNDEPDPVRRIGWRRRAPAPLQKVVARGVLPVTIHQGNHGASYLESAPVPGQLVVRHFPYRSVEQFVSKVRNGAAAYAAATDLPPDMGDHWRGYGRILEERGEDGIAEVFRTWFWSPDPDADADLIYDPAPMTA